jgi:PHD/YefM family antitoxin component YafN of YafNO toxin-antitoxin module
MLVISSREFRQNQRLYFDKVDEGEQVVVQRGKDKSYVLTAVTEGDLYFNAEMIARIKKSLEEARKGETTRVENKQELKALLRSL